MNDETTQQLRRSLRQGADGLPYAPDLTGPAITQARGIRRRRRAAAVLAVAAVVAVGVPLGLQVGGAVSSTEPSVATVPAPPQQVTLDLAALPPGDDLPDIPYRQFDAYLFAEGSYDLGGLDPYEIAAWDAGAALLVSEGDGLKGTLYVADGSGPELIADGVESIGASAGGQYLAYVTDGTLLLWDAAEAASPSNPTSVPVPVGADIVSVTNEAQVLVSPAKGPSLLMDRRGVETALAPGVTAWSLGDFLLANVTSVDDVLNACSAVRDGAGDVLWRTCDWTVRSFSPDGRWAYATPSSADGYGAVEIAILDARTGDVVRTVEMAGGDGVTGFVRDAAWESGDRLLLRVLVEDAGDEIGLLADRGREGSGLPSTAAALVRLDVTTGDVELAAGPVEVRPAIGDNPFLLS